MSEHPELYELGERPTKPSRGLTVERQTYEETLDELMLALMMASSFAQALESYTLDPVAQQTFHNQAVVTEGFATACEHLKSRSSR